MQRSAFALPTLTLILHSSLLLGMQTPDKGRQPAKYSIWSENMEKSTDYHSIMIRDKAIEKMYYCSRALSTTPRWFIGYMPFSTHRGIEKYGEFSANNTLANSKIIPHISKNQDKITQKATWNNQIKDKHPLKLLLGITYVKKSGSSNQKNYKSCKKSFGGMYYRAK